MNKPPRPRRGAALLIALTALILVAVAISLALRTNLTARREARRAAAALQAEYLANAGLELALAQLETSPEYSGEVWQVAGEVLAGRDTAQVTIEIAAESTDETARRIVVVAEFPTGDSPLKHRHRLERLWKPTVLSEDVTP
jgi:type II secretory pathway component PulK